MNAKELRERYIRFFEERGHRRIPSAPLLPENDPTVLFTTAGMHPLVPFLLGEPHPQGQRLVNFQRCIRTNDIDEVGDLSHLTFFEMLGNWSLGDYFKEQSIRWSYEFLTSELGIDPARLAVTVFTGDSDAPRDELSAGVWRNLGIPEERIFFLPKADNWWGPAGITGPCGPDSEIFYDTGAPDHESCRPGCSCGKWLEIWNNVFMEYNKNADGTYSKLKQQNVDTGMGVERTVAVLQGAGDVFTIETLRPLVQAVEELTGDSGNVRVRYEDNPAPFRIVADHVRSATFAIADGAMPSNVEAGYVVRRMIRRAVRTARMLGIRENFTAGLSLKVIEIFRDVYPHLNDRVEEIAAAMEREESKFKETLERGLKEVERVFNRAREAGQTEVGGAEAFDLFETYGFPLSLTVELAKEQGLTVDEAGFDAAYRAHREQSRQALEQRYKGGLADHSESTTRLHTAAHLLQAALRRVLGEGVRQMGSNITADRLRFDFSHPQRLTEEQLAAVERMVNEQIERDLPVSMRVTTLDEALKDGALAFFGDKYGDQVKVYAIGDFSMEVCGGPHVSRTAELGRFKIAKQEAVGQGVRRIRGVLE